MNKSGWIKCENKKCKNYEAGDKNGTGTYLNNCEEFMDIEDCKNAVVRQVSEREVKLHSELN